jgi:hypothetical protein
MANDAVNHPAHYCGAIETIDFIRDKLTPDQFVGYCLGNVMKYVSRYRDKGGKQDLEKAEVYLGWAIEHYDDDKGVIIKTLEDLEAQPEYVLLCEESKRLVRQAFGFEIGVAPNE